MVKSLLRDRKGQGLVEYGLLIAGVALVCAAAVSVFGHKTNDLVAAVATTLPGAHARDNGPITSGRIIETTDTDSAGTPIEIDFADIYANNGEQRFGNRLLTNNNFLLAALVYDQGQ